MFLSIEPPQCVGRQRRRQCPGLRKLDAIERLPKLRANLFHRVFLRSREVQEQLERLQAFYDTDTRPLREALAIVGVAGTHVANAERDALFIRSSFAGVSTGGPARRVA